MATKKKTSKKSQESDFVAVEGVPQRDLYVPTYADGITLESYYKYPTNPWDTSVSSYVEVSTTNDFDKLVSNVLLSAFINCPVSVASGTIEQGVLRYMVNNESLFEIDLRGFVLTSNITITNYPVKIDPFLLRAGDLVRIRAEYTLKTGGKMNIEVICRLFLGGVRQNPPNVSF